ncbi:hypothetical protein [uncultured Chryseobacterium sp.]|uniref:hypothetical protein n=1 Tax=uncultured Chryseobacterium sp. TaxID=259322 RepID=UPI0025FE6B24|nr:hypothetical protein [uncultured Chryseobacterium sp.]
MKKYFRNLFGISELESSAERLELLSKKQNEDFERYETIQKEREQILTDLLSKVQGNDNYLAVAKETNINLSQDDQIEISDEIVIDENFAFKRIDTDELGKKINGFTLVSNEESSNGLLSSFAGLSSNIGTAKYVANSFYTTTASSSQLMKYANNSFSSIIKDGGKFSKHIGFVKGNIGALTPMIAFQVLTMVTAQAHMQEISKKLNLINDKISFLLTFHKNERIAKLKYINTQLEELYKRSFFTVEDFVLINSFKYDLQVIKDESYQLFVKALFDIQKKHSLTINPVLNEENNFSDNSVKKIWKQTKLFFEHSKSDVSKLLMSFKEFDLFTYGEIALTSERLFDNLLLVELQSNLKVRNLDQDRIGKIDELKKNLENNMSSPKIEDDIKLVFKDFKENLNYYLSQKEDSAFQNIFSRNKEQIRNLKEDLSNDFEFLETLLQTENSKTGSEIISSFDDNYEIIIDNSGAKELIYMKPLSSSFQ